MGRTQPSLTAAVDRELNKLEMVSSRLKDERLRAKVQVLRRRVRQIEGALEDEPTDPLEIVLIASLMDDENKASMSFDLREGADEAKPTDRCGLACVPWGTGGLTSAEVAASLTAWMSAPRPGNRPPLRCERSSPIAEAGTPKGGEDVSEA